jgi:hypothetical protein
MRLVRNGYYNSVLDSVCTYLLIVKNCECLKKRSWRIKYTIDLPLTSTHMLPYYAFCRKSKMVCEYLFEISLLLMQNI